MIAIVSSQPRERAALAALCEGRGWTCVECESLQAFKKHVRQSALRIVLVRHKLTDGYSDDVIETLRAVELLPSAKVIVLVEASTRPSAEARQVALGADHVQRDPIRIDVLIEYILKYLGAQKSGPRRRARASGSFFCAGATVFPLDRRAERRGRAAALTPREVQLAELLAANAGEVLTYTTLYAEILGRRFRGDTSNMRVLLAKLDATLRAIGADVRGSVEVIPKTGYRYRAPVAG